jgi:hypothetical protein
MRKQSAQASLAFSTSVATINLIRNWYEVSIWRYRRERRIVGAWNDNVIFRFRDGFFLSNKFQQV